jgi:hypothetical protein
MSVTQGQITIQLAGKEVLSEVEAPAALNENQRTMRTGNKGLSKSTRNSSSTPLIDQPLVSFELTLNSGTPTTVDLAAVQALVQPAGLTRTVDLTGAKLIAWLFETPAENTGVATVAPGDTNPYPSLFGSGKSIDLAAGRVEAGAVKGMASNLAAVAAGVKTLKFSTTQTGDKIYVELWAGDDS